MKKLEELGISKGLDKNRPWCATENGEFVCAEDTTDAVAQIFGESKPQIMANACLIESAPIMYKAIEDSLPIIEYLTKFFEVHAGHVIKARTGKDSKYMAIIMKTIKAITQDMKDALARASGEMEAKQCK